MGRPLEDGAEAILRPDGTIEHAEEPAKAPRKRATLRRFAIEIDRARSRLRRDDPDRALEVWTALTSGRWTLLDHFDKDGRRYLVARRNDPRIAEPFALSERERQVVAYAARGQSCKLIGYELGLSPSVVSRELASAMSKLGVRGRAELVALLAPAAHANDRPATS
jgi:DNA-binding CsgD family transcriptional regulator